MTKCTFCGAILRYTKRPTVFAYMGTLYCTKSCADARMKELVRSNGEYVDKTILKGE